MCLEEEPRLLFWLVDLVYITVLERECVACASGSRVLKKKGKGGGGGGGGILGVGAQESDEA